MSNGIGKNPLNDISKVYLDQVAEKKDDSYLEPDMKKRQKNNEKARKDMEKVPGQKNPHFEETQKEALDPVGQEDGDVNNDGKKNKTDDYLMKRRKAIAKALKKEEVEVPKKDLKRLVAKAVKRVDADVDGDVDGKDSNAVGYGEFVPSADGKKKIKTNVQKESFSNWRQDLSEVIGDEGKDSEKIKEKKINNKIKINPSFGEAIEEIGGTIIEMIEVDVFEDAKMGKQSDEKLSSLHKQVSSADQSLPSNQFMLKRVQKEINRRKKATKTEGYNIGEQDESDSKDDQMIQKRKQMLQKQYMLDKQRLQMQRQGKLPSGHRVEQVEVEEGVLDAALETDKKVGELHKKVDNDVKRMKDGKKFKEEVESEAYQPMTPERKLRVDKAKRNAYDNDQRAQHKGDKKEADKQFKRRMAMDSKTKMRKEEVVNEEGADSLKDRRMERGGVDGNNRYKSAPKPANTAGKKKPYDGMSALEKVKASIRAKHGEGAIMDTKKKVVGENVSSGKSRMAKMGRVQPKSVGSISNDDYVRDSKKKKESNAKSDTKVGDEAFKKASSSGLSPSEALTAKRRAEREAARSRYRSENPSLRKFKK